MLVKAVFAGKEMISNKEPFLTCKKQASFLIKTKVFNVTMFNFTTLLKNDNLNIYF